MTDTFPYKVTAEASGQSKYIVNKTQYGDGYAQSSARGLNNKVQSWTVTAVGTQAEMREIADWLDAKMGAESFFWTPPLGDQGYYVCTGHNPRKMGKTWTLTMNFEQGYKP